MQAVETGPTPTTTTTGTGRTAQEWLQVITGLNTLVQTYDNEIATLTHDRDLLALDAALGDAQAAKRQQQITASITTKQNAAQSTRAAIKQAEVKKRQAEQAEADVIEQDRQSEMKILAAAIIESAINTDGHMEQLVMHANTLKQAVRDMQAIATNQESKSLDLLLRPEILMRAAECAGLRNHILFQAYPGPREHLIPLAVAMSSTLERWLTPAAIAVEEIPAAAVEQVEDKQDRRTGGPGWTEQLKKKIHFHKKEK